MDLNNFLSKLNTELGLEEAEVPPTFPGAKVPKKKKTELIKRARKGEGPSLVECVCFRLREHSVIDFRRPNYRPKGEVEEWMKKEPLKRFKEQLIGMGILTEEKADEIDREMLEEVDRAVKFAEESPFLEPEKISEYVYA